MDEYLQINHCDSPSNKMNDKNHMIISIHAENHLTKFKINYDKKTLNKVDIEETYLHIIEVIMVIEMCQTEKDKYHIILLMCDI